MLYDLNLAWLPDSSPAQLERTLKFALSLGYDVVGLNHVVSAPIPSNVVNPIPLLTPPPTSHPQPPNKTPSKNPPTKPPPSASPEKLPTTLRRATVVIADPAINHRLPAFAAAYDIVAVRPTTEKAFAACCTTMSEFSIISLDLTGFFPFHFHPRTSMAAVSRGIRFEICYAQALSSSSSSASSSSSPSPSTAAADPRLRANFVANLAGLVRATKGRGIVLSSEARSALELRGPADVVNLLAVWGLGAEKGKEAQAANPRAIVANEGIKRRGFRGVVDVLQGTDKAPSSLAEDEAGDGDGAEAERRASSEKQNKRGQKRPGEEAGKDVGIGPSSTGERQAKKVRFQSPEEESSS